MAASAPAPPGGGSPLHLAPPGRVWPRLLKRPADVAFSLLALLCLLPLLLLIALALILLQGGSPIFAQRRVGRGLKPFSIIKFRTMNDKRAPDGSLLPDEERVTWIGGLLRASSLDELPELLNVLRGDMSLIGPRPWIPAQMASFAPHTQLRRMALRPGVTGLAQIQGRNNLTFRQRVAFDLRYARHLSFALDASILFYTVWKVVKREGIYQRPDALGKPARPVAPKDPQSKGLRGNKPRVSPASSQEPAHASPSRQSLAGPRAGAD